MHVVESFCGGALTSIIQIVNNLDPDKFQISLVYSLRPETPSDFQAMIHPWVRLINLAMAREVKPIKDFRSLLQLFRLFVKERPDVVHLHSSKAGVLGRIAARLAGLPKVFYSPRGFSFLSQEVSQKKRDRYRIYERFAARFGGTVVACSPSELEAARQVTPKAILINNAIDVDVIDRIIQSNPAARSERDRKITAGTAGRIVPQKAPALFARIAEEVTAARPGQIRFLWIGGGEESRRLSPAAVEVTGWLPREDAVKTVYQQVDIYLHTSLWEGMPLSILEAMTLGKPVVATDCVGNRDVVAHGETGFLASRPDELAKGLLRLVDAPMLRDKMGRAGRARVLSEFSLPLLIRNISQLYQDC